MAACDLERRVLVDSVLCVATTGANDSCEPEGHVRIYIRVKKLKKNVIKKIKKYIYITYCNGVEPLHETFHGKSGKGSRCGSHLDLLCG